MATNILMPALSPTMTEGTLARWLKHEGDAIRAGDVIAEIETDKATMEVEAVDEGVLGKILVPDGTEGVKVNDPIAVLVDAGEAAPAKAAAKAEPPKSETKPAQPPKDSEAVKPAPAKSPASQPGANGHAEAERIFASPLARRMAQQAGIDLAKLQGSGPNGRIVRADIEKAHGAPAAAAAAPATQAPPPPAVASQAAPITAPHDKLPLNNIRKVTARRLLDAKQTIPHFYVSIDVELDALLKLRTELNAKSPKDGPGAFRLSVNDLLIKAAAVTLRRVPKVNASFTPDAIILYKDVDISVAVSISDGLITPIIRQADRKGLAAISNEAKDLIARARAGKLKPEEFQGGSFSISNMGMYGVSEFSAIINPPQAGILAIAAGLQRPVVKNGELAVATVMTVTLSVDHRAIDGALAAEWVATFKSVVEDPLTLML
ncbi:MAG TPA: pyruvate dehydrogenase complex dihydrolipoamide acetyltransferase [Acetobacteraceae bacterium]|nr:pyruvate dehydrogenase complex dihydrolipoamide acetyltransferase [Acetobacteraceae bacterium]